MPEALRSRVPRLQFSLGVKNGWNCLQDPFCWREAESKAGSGHPGEGDLVDGGAEREDGRGYRAWVPVPSSPHSLARP